MEKELLKEIEPVAAIDESKVTETKTETTKPTGVVPKAESSDPATGVVAVDKPTVVKTGAAAGATIIKVKILSADSAWLDSEEQIFNMAEGLSSNWKKLQATLKTEPSSSSSSSLAPAKDKEAPAKRKAGGPLPAQAKRQRLEQTQQPNRPVAKPTPKGAKSSGPAMGVAQSSAVAKGSSSTVNPSLALWAEDHDISAEALAEAYGLGIKRNALVVSEKPRVNEGLAPGIEIGKYVAMDCEMVGVGPDGHDSVLARVSLVDFHGRQVYDSFVRPRERVTDWRTKITGITAKHMATAREFDAVQQEVADLIKGRILVGHDIRHDLAVLMLTHPTTHIRDTARFSGFRQYGNGPKPALRTLAKELLDMEIQTGHHSSIEDAKVAMLLFRKKKSEFDMEHANKFERTEKTAGKGGNKPKTSKKKSRR